MAAPHDATPEQEGPAGDVLVDRHQRLFSRTLVVSTLTLASRVVGFLREMLSAALFGDRSPIFDAFLTAWRVPNLFRRFLGEGALSTSLQRAITSADAELGDRGGRAIFGATVRLTLWLLVGLCALVMVLVAHMPDAMPFTGWPWLGADPAPVRELTVRVMPYVVLVCLSALCMGGLHVRGHFLSPAGAPVVMNLVWVATLVAIGARWGWPGSGAPPEDVQLEMARFLAWGVLAAGLLQLAVQLPALVRRGLVARGAGKPEPSEAGARRRSAWAVLRSSAPLALGAAVYQINVMLDGLMAEELLPDGGPTAHYYANRVQQFPMALVSIAATTAVFPALQALAVRRRLAELRELHDRTQLAIVFLALPASVGLAVLAEPLAAVLFQRGAFGAEGVERVAAALRMLALALLPAGAAGLLGRTYYAVGDYRTPVRISAAMLVANVALNALLVVGADMDADGLALATAITSWVNAGLLLPGLRRRLGLPAARVASALRLAKIALASAACGLGAALAHGGTARLLGAPPEGEDRSVAALVAGILAGAGAFAAVASLLRSPDWSDAAARLRAVLGRSRAR